MALDPVETLSQLVAIPSVNPMGRDVSGPEFYEYRLTDHLQSIFERLHLPWQRQTIDEKRDNIIARLDGLTPPEEGGQLIMFEAHQDTVPVDGMSIEPWTPVVRDGRLYGRGSCDIKGGMSAMLAALSRLAEEPPPGMPTIIMACTVNEEHGYSGAADLEKLWQDGTSGSIIPRRPDACVVAEPTNLDVVVAHKGAVRWRVHTHGRAGHSSQPDLGDNAVYKMARVLAALENYHLEVAPRFPEHPLCGPATLSVGTIHGGLSVNTIPDLCTIEVDRRLLPGEKNDEVYRHVVDYVANYPGIDFEVDHERPFLDGSALSNDNNGPLAERLASVVQRLYGHGQKIGVPFGTDASKIAAAGVPSVVFGPGSINQAHTADEWLSLDELAKAADVLYEFGKAGL